jgi:hypothetical protein
MKTLFAISLSFSNLQFYGKQVFPYWEKLFCLASPEKREKDCYHWQVHSVSRSRFVDASGARNAYLVTIFVYLDI